MLIGAGTDNTFERQHIVIKNAVLCMLLIWIFASGAVAHNQRRPRRSSTHPPESNHRELRELTGEEIVIYTGGELRIYSTVIPAADRRGAFY